MKTKTNMNAGSWFNHNQTLVGGLRVKTAVKAGDPAVPLALTVNHNETLVRGLRVKTAVKAGDPAVPLALTVNHNETLVRGLRVKTAVKAGDPAVPLALTVNHNETLRVGWSVRDQNAGVEIEPTELDIIAASLRVQTGLLAGKGPRPFLPCV
jgi:hypothetical protein